MSTSPGVIRPFMTCRDPTRTTAHLPTALRISTVRAAAASMRAARTLSSRVRALSASTPSPPRRPPGPPGHHPPALVPPPSKRLHEGDRRQGLADPGGDLSFLRSLRSDRDLDPAKEIEEGAVERHNRGQDDQAQLPVQCEHEREHAEKDERMGRDLDHRVPEQLAEGRGFRGELGEQLTRPSPIEEGKGQALEVGEEPVPFLLQSGTV